MYEKLLLANGGGVTGDSQKGDQVGNCVNIIIGLGGTGKFCVRMIKTYAHQRIKFGPNDTNGEFQHIRFFAVDTDFNNNVQNQDSSLMSLTSDEVLNIEDKNLLAGMPKAPWNDWWDWEDENSKAIAGNGAGGERRLGRIYLSYSAYDVLRKIRNFYNIATQGVTLTSTANGSAANVFFHVISGMGGGTGSGTFIDMCYLLKHDYPQANIIGYFFLPEVNEDVVAAKATKEYIEQNGFAAMQDLDYVMQLGTNGDSFSQNYNGLNTPVRWDKAPVRICHIISNSGAVGLGSPKERYNYAMNVAAEYIMDFLVQSNNVSHNIISEIANRDQNVNTINSKRASGYTCEYSVMGSSCAVVPYREINTYVISKLFESFADFHKVAVGVPSAKDCFNILKNAFAPIAATQEDINRAVFQKAASGLNTGVYTPYPDSLTDLNWDDVVTDDDALKELRTSVLIPKPLHDWYFKQYSDKIGVIEKNKSSLSNPGNAESLIGLIRAQLDIITRDIRRGPSFAVKTIDAAARESLKDFVEGLIAANRAIYNNAFENLSFRAAEYNETVEKIKKKNAKGKRGEAAQSALMAFFNQLGTIDLYESIVSVLTTLKAQLVGSAKNDYARIESVYNELAARFDSNLNAIQSGNSTVVDISYAEYLVTVDQLKKALDKELENAVPNIPNVYDEFMAWITQPQKKELLLPEHENEFIEHVNSFFIGDGNSLFKNIVAMTIDDYLKMAVANDKNIDNWHTITNTEVQGYVDEKFRSLMSKAQPLFSQNIQIQGRLGAPTGWITIPQGSAAISAAAQQYKAGGLQINPSALSDRIFIEMRYDGASLSAMQSVGGMESVSTQESSRHLYSGFPKIEGKFIDWGKLPPLTPYQMWNKSGNPSFSQVDTDSAAFDDALECGVIVPVSNGNPAKDFVNGIVIREFNAEAIEALSGDVEKLKEAIDSLNLIDAEIDGERAGINKKIDALKARLDGLYTAGTVYNMTFDTTSRNNPADPFDINYRKAFYKDMFVRAPQITLNVKNQLKQKEKFFAVKNAVEECERLAQRRFSAADEEVKVRPIFESALFTGMFKIEGNNISCSCIDEKTGRELMPEYLANASDRRAFPYYNIPIYQAFLTFKTLDADVIEKIRLVADDKANKMFAKGSAIDESVESFMDRMSVWYKLADKTSNSKEITDFLENEHEQFNLFKEERGL